MLHYVIDLFLYILVNNVTKLLLDIENKGNKMYSYMAFTAYACLLQLPTNLELDFLYQIGVFITTQYW